MPTDSGVGGVLWSIGLSAVSVSFGLVGVGVVFVSALMVVAGTVFVVRASRSDSVASAVGFVIGSWLFAPLVRRIVDWQNGFVDPSPLLLVAPVITVATLLVVVTPGRLQRAPRPLLIAGAVWAIGLSYAAFSGLLQHGPTTVVAALADWVPPLGLMLIIGCSGTREFWSAQLSRLSSVVVIIISSYAIVQWVTVPIWDLRWYENSEIVGFFGRAEPYELRAWGPLNSPYAMATSLVWGVSWSLTERDWRLRYPALLLGVAALGITTIRAAWVWMALLLLLTLRHRPRTIMILGGVLVLATVVAGASGLPVLDRVQERVTESRSEGLQDDSLIDRVEQYQRVGEGLLADPVGTGLGSVGSAGRGVDGNDDAGRNLDSLLLEVGSAFGLVLGVLVLGVSLWLILGAVRSGASTAPGAAAFVALVPIQGWLGNPLVSVPGTFVLGSVGALLAHSQHAGVADRFPSSPRPDGPTHSDRTAATVLENPPTPKSP